MKPRRLFPAGQIFFAFICLFCAVTIFFSAQYTPLRFLAMGELAVVVTSVLVFRHWIVQRRASAATLARQFFPDSQSPVFPFPVVLIHLPDGEILWANDLFYTAIAEPPGLFPRSIADFFDDFDLHWLLEGHTEFPHAITLEGRNYLISGALMHTEPEKTAALFLTDCSELHALRKEYALTRPVVCILLMDNYDDALKNLTDSQRSSVLALVDEKIAAWAIPLEGVFRKTDRDRYVLLIETRALNTILQQKFSILDDVRTVMGAPGIPMTLSIGIGKDAESLAESFSFAQLAIEMSLSRGGNRAVIKNKHHFEFYGGHTKEIEKRTKVTSRVTAESLKKLIRDSSQVLVMGHDFPDADCLGAAVGIARISRTLKKKVHVVVKNTAVPELLHRLQEQSETAELFIDDQEAMVLCDINTLLVIVDCNKPDITTSPALLEAATRVVLIDHHRRGISSAFIEDAVLTFHEPSASSTSELVCELLQNIIRSEELTRVEAEALLCGIVLDTKNFTMHTGMRTFEAAAYLRGAGADTMEIKRYFQNDYASSLAKYEIISNATMLHGHIAMAMINKKVSRVVAAGAADELLGIEKVDASFVIAADDAGAVLSARSLGNVDVQSICEKLGGGGHQSMAGAQMPGVSPGEMQLRLADAINAYLDN